MFYDGGQRARRLSRDGKASGAICNLDCEYCYYLSKEMLYPGSRPRMANDPHRTA